VASYRHARDVIAEHGDPVMAPWLALTADGMLLAALVVIWVRRHHHEPVGAGPWAAFWADMTATIAANLAAAQSTPVGIVVALWPPICLAMTLELIALVASQAKHHPVTGTVPAGWSAHVPDHAQLVPAHGPAVTGLDDRAPETRETGEANQPGHDTGTDRGHPVGERPADDLERVPAAMPAGTAPATNGHVPAREPTSPAPDPQDAVDPARQAPAPASGHGSDTEPRHQADQNGHHRAARTGRVPDDDILAWLREQSGTTGKVPGRRKLIDKWALGSPRADRLRRIIHAETAPNAATASPG
jgi:hypothetical protein